MSLNAPGSAQGIGLWVVCAAVIIAAIFAYNRSRVRRTLLGLAEVLDERSGTPHGLLANRMTGHAGGREVELGVDSASKNRPQRFHIRMQCVAEQRLRVTRQWAGSRLASRIGLLQDVEIGDAEFDSRFVLSAADPARLRAWLERSVEVRMLVSTMFDRGVDELTLASGALRATLVAYRGEEIAPDNVRMLLEALGRFAASAANA